MSLHEWNAFEVKTNYHVLYFNHCNIFNLSLPLLCTQIKFYATRNIMLSPFHTFWPFCSFCILSCCSISYCLTRAYAALPPSTTQLENHHRMDLESLYQYVASTVCTHAFAVPEILCVNGDVT